MAITVTAVAETQGLRLSPAGSRGRLEALAALGGDSEGRSTQSELSTAPPGPDPGRDLSPPGRDRPQPGPESPGRARGTAGRVSAGAAAAAAPRYGEPACPAQRENFSNEQTRAPIRKGPMGGSKQATLLC